MKVEKEYLEYLNKLNTEDRNWVSQFYNEYYCAPTRDDNSIIKDPEMIKEANRIHNSMYRDLFSIAEKTGALSELSEDQDRFMQEASDEWDWNDEFKKNGFESAIKEIFYQTKRDLENPEINVMITLARFLSKYLSLRKINNRKRR